MAGRVLLDLIEIALSSKAHQQPLHYCVGFALVKYSDNHLLDAPSQCSASLPKPTSELSSIG